MKGQPAFDAFDLKAAENNEFGAATVDARHFTEYSQKHDTGAAGLDTDIPHLVKLMNPMYFLTRKSETRAKYWFLRAGTRDTDTSPTVLANIAARIAGFGQVDSRMYWDGGHGVNQDPGKFIAWAAQITGYSTD
jgi:hypothetical protein